eukprot:590008_1
MSDSGLFPIIKPFVFGGAAGMFATSCIQPIDMVKVQIQLQGDGGKNIQVHSKNPFKIGAFIVREKGVGGLYHGLSAGLLRQATYTTARMGLFRTFSNAALADGEKRLAFWKRCLCSLSAGGLASIIGTPADVALIRMQADTTLPPAQRRGYKNVFDALSTMARNDGVMSWWSGCQPTVYRAMLLNLGMLAMYDQSKDFTNKHLGAGHLSTAAAGSISAFCACVLSLPCDLIKTRLQKQMPLADGSLRFKGVFDCGSQIVRNEGVTALYTGFPTFVARIAPHIIITWFAVEHFNKKYDQLTGKTKEE